MVSFKKGNINIDIFVYTFMVLTVLFSYTPFLNFSVWLSMILLFFMGLRYVYTVKFDIFTVLRLLFCVWLIVALFWSVNMDYGLIKTRTVVLITIMDIFLYEIIAKRRIAEKCIKTLMYANIMLCIIVLIYYNPSEIIAAFDSTIRIGDKISQENVLGMLLAIGGTILFFYFMVEKKTRYLIWFVLSFILAMATGSKRALILLVVGVITTLFFKVGRKHFFVFLAISISGLFIINYVIHLPAFQIIGTRVDDFFYAFNNDNMIVIDKSTYYRNQMIDFGIYLFKESPFWGHGSGSYGTLATNLAGLRIAYSHNNYIELLVNNGLVGFLSYYLINLYILVKSCKPALRGDSMSQLIVICGILVLISDIAGVNYYDKYTHLIIVISAAYIRCQNLSLNKKPSEIQISV